MQKFSYILKMHTTNMPFEHLFPIDSTLTIIFVSLTVTEQTMLCITHSIIVNIFSALQYITFNMLEIVQYY